MEYTGERIIPKVMNPKHGLVKEHIARYEFAAQFSVGRVLDLASGVGYGTRILLEGPNRDNIQEIIGLDLDEETISYAKKNYSDKKVSYYRRDVSDPNLSTDFGIFDTIVSLETVEHIEDDYGFIQNLAKLLKPGGKAIISTPFGKGRDHECSNPYHFRQYTEEEFLDLLSPFKKIEMYHQLDEVIEKPIEDKKYYLMVAVGTL